MPAPTSSYRQFPAMLGVLLTSVQVAADPPAPTPIEEVVMYAIENNTSELLRYNFALDAFFTIGPILDPAGVLITDLEASALIPSGPHVGMYAAANFFEANGKPSRLVKISGFDGSAEYLPSHIGYGKVEGLVAYERNPGDWVLIGASKTGPELATGAPKNGTNQGPHLFMINPATGQAIAGGEAQHRYNGLALSPQGRLYGIDRDNHLYDINVVFSPFTVVGEYGNVGLSPTHNQLEALEWAYGDNQPTIDCSQVPASWTVNGILFSFSDDDDAFLVIQPATGEVRELNCSFQTFDAEGLMFTTVRRDPWGPIHANTCD